jgi:hypothetical protein
LRYSREFDRVQVKVVLSSTSSSILVLGLCLRTRLNDPDVVLEKDQFRYISALVVCEITKRQIGVCWNQMNVDEVSDEAR